MKEKMGTSNVDDENPIFKTITTFIAFNVVGVISLLPFIFLFVINNPSGFTTSDIFIYSIIFTAFAFFVWALSLEELLTNLQYDLVLSP